MKMAAVKVSVINDCTVLTDAEIAAAVPDLQTQVHRDFCPAWGTDADLVFVPKGKKPDPGTWWLVIMDYSDQQGALGYHDLTPEGMPIGKVFAASDKENGYNWTVTTSHELLEMLGDPDIDLVVFVQHSERSGMLYAYEACDACEDDKYGYKIGQTTVSDFVHPAWFRSSVTRGTKLDHMGHISKPLELIDGGYIGAFNVTRGGGWTQLEPQGQHAMKARPHRGSRRERRTIPKDKWIKSTAWTK